MLTVFHMVVTLSVRPPYWEDPRIHSLGNGKVHATLARAATKLIDLVSYNGRDIRKELLAKHAAGCSVVDLCCGTGTSTPYGGVGIDTSPAMIREAIWRRGPTQSFCVANAETYGENNAFDVATIFFALHEMPQEARLKVLKNATRIARKRVLV